MAPANCSLSAALVLMRQFEDLEYVVNLIYSKHQMLLILLFWHCAEFDFIFWLPSWFFLDVVIQYLQNIACAVYLKNISKKSLPILYPITSMCLHTSEYAAMQYIKLYWDSWLMFSLFNV